MLHVQRDANRMSFQTVQYWLTAQGNLLHMGKKEVLHTFGVLPIHLNVLDHDK